MTQLTVLTQSLLAGREQLGPRLVEGSLMELTGLRILWAHVLTRTSLALSLALPATAVAFVRRDALGETLASAATLAARGYLALTPLCCALAFWLDRQSRARKLTVGVLTVWVLVTALLTYALKARESAPIYVRSARADLCAPHDRQTAR